ncbi:MAG: polymer-forming cytoskeletal protein [Erysipelothrix sp.]|nr:polymer-forming cytoskeletal protein [Erysipelothrix sp.]
MNWGRDKGQDEPVEISRDESIESSGDIVLSNSAQIEGRLKGNNVYIMNGNITGDINLNNYVIL